MRRQSADGQYKQPAFFRVTNRSFLIDCSWLQVSGAKDILVGRLLNAKLHGNCAT